MQQADRTIYVGNVGKEIDEAALMALFGHCGTVSVFQRLTLNKDNRAKHFSSSFGIAIEFCSISWGNLSHDMLLHDGLAACLSESCLDAAGDTDQNRWRPEL